MSDELVHNLHDRASRGEELSPEEQERLSAWYAELDRAEAADLGSVVVASGDPLPSRIERTLAEIARATRRIQDLERQTHEVERQNADLRLRLGRHLSAQRA